MAARRPGEAINLDTFDHFSSHRWLDPIKDRYRREAILAKHTVERLVDDLESINQEYLVEEGRVAFTTIEGRVKSEDSLLRKLYKGCRKHVQSTGVTPAVLEKRYNAIHDLSGVRLACPYFDDIKTAIEALVRPKLQNLGYATDLKDDGLPDQDYLDTGDEVGYRSYHLFLRVPTVVNIYNEVEMATAELQARSELQHVWAVKSHDLLYKKERGWVVEDFDVVEDMKQLSNSLRAADQTLISIRNRVRKRS